MGDTIHDPDETKPVNVDHWYHCHMPYLAQIGSLRVLLVLQRIGDAYGFKFENKPICFQAEVVRGDPIWF